MTAFIRLCRFVDWDLTKTGYIRSGAWSIAIGLATASLPLPFLDFPYRGWEAVVIAIAAALGLAWYTFVAWRGWRLVRSAGVRGDRDYDRQGKYDLPSEYAATESATMAAGRGRKQNAT
jgi:hypothetical protein